MIKGVCFDLDGTLIDSELIILKSFDYAFRKNLKIVKKDISFYNQFMGPPLYTTYSRFTNDQKIIDQMVDDFIKYYADNELPLIKSFPGMYETLDYLKENDIKIILVSNKLLSSTTQSIAKYHLDDYFDYKMTIDIAGAPKPDPKCIQLVLEHYNFSKDEIIMVGDSDVDILCAKDCGARTALCMWTAWAKNQEYTSPTYKINKLTDIINIIKEINK